MKDKEQFILDNYRTMKVQEIADMLDMTYSQVQSVARRNGVRKYRSSSWSEEEVAFLREHFPRMKGKWVAEKLGRGFHATHKMAEKLGIKAEWDYTYVCNMGYLMDCTDRENKFHIHRAVMEHVLGRELTSDEIVHHKDGNKLNNNPNNLEVVTRSEHIELHRHELEIARGIRKR